MDKGKANRDEERVWFRRPGGSGLEGEILQSFATGAVSVEDTGIAGGLVGLNSSSTIEDQRDPGTVTGLDDTIVGGLIGQEYKFRGENETVETSYSIGAASAGQSSFVGGFVGTSTGDSDYTDAYWDTTTSGTSQASGKGKARGVEACRPSSCNRARLRASIRHLAENPKVNNGMPYLLNNPPPKNRQACRWHRSTAPLRTRSACPRPALVASSRGKDGGT